MLSMSTPNEHSSRTLRFSLCLVSVSTDIWLHRDLCLHNVWFLSPVFEFSIWMSFPVRNESLDGGRGVVWSTWFYQFFRTARKSSGCPCVLNCIFLAGWWRMLRACFRLRNEMCPVLHDGRVRSSVWCACGRDMLQGISPHLERGPTESKKPLVPSPTS